jgi:uncharacterized repeat protein (TIGR01451 family)
MKTKWSLLIVVVLLISLVSGVTSAWSQSEITYSISGFVFNDVNGDGLWDADDNGLNGAYVDVDAQCTGETAFSIPVNIDGSYSLTDVLSGACVVLSGRHPTDMYGYGWKQTTPLVKFDSLSQHQTGVNIGLQQYALDYTPKDSGPPDFLQALPDGQLNQLYKATITVFGGVPPYYSSMGSEGNLPLNGLEVFMDENTGVITISGTPTEAGRYTLDMYVNDVNGVTIEVQGSFFIKTDATFNLTTSANPSNAGDPVTFTLSASGTVVDYLPHGSVTFKADGVVIAGCDQLILGYDEYYNYINPVLCTTSALAAGSHVITTDFIPIWGPYNAATVTLEGGQVVGTAIAPPVVTYSFVQPEPSLAGYPILRHYIYFTGNAGDGNYSCTVDYGDGSAVVDGRVEDRNGVDEFICDDYNNPYHIYANPGTYTLTYTIHDIYDNETIYQVPHIVIADQDWGLITWSPTPAVVNQPVLLTTTQTAQNYMWLLASGPDITQPMEIGYGPSVTFTPSASGTYKAELFLVNVDGMNISVVSDGVEIVVVEPVQADLSLTKTDSKDPIKPGDKLVYTLTISNLGPNTAESVVLFDKLDANTTYVSTSAPKGWKCSYAKNSAMVSCNSASMVSGGTAIIKITVAVNKTAKVGKELVNTAEVSSTTYDPEMANNTVTQKTMVSK